MNQIDANKLVHKHLSAFYQKHFKPTLIDWENWLNALHIESRVELQKHGFKFFKNNFSFAHWHSTIHNDGAAVDQAMFKCFSLPLFLFYLKSYRGFSSQKTTALLSEFGLLNAQIQPIKNEKNT